MTTMKQKLAAGGLAIILATSAVSSFAKEGDKGPRRDNVNLDYIFTELALTEEQQADVNAVLQAFRDQADEQRKAAREERRDAEDRPSREEMAEIRQAHREAMIEGLTDELNKVLSADQTEDFVTYFEAHSQKGPRNKEGGNRS
ncbi:Spy/CpxP family protein refolding chaperone [Reinekea thalattae]|uniref:Periplasmic heavy metal sensor n=1 Tax=Reinekea thalattae TaxID=2593301 RepID=A0A5C8Z362_9GAMM|nr:Spy/CpxP family protein refolding chaperone [Reinekea thalattae]TXR51336.1 hypothetical protein FME95_12450 [Reinekea thalattae]